MKYYDSLRLIFLKRPLRLERPKVIQFPVIDICNSKCQMCRIWENKKSEDITIDQLRSGLSSKLFSEVAGIGFNGGEPTLRSDLPDLVQIAIDCLPSLKNISLITNAYNYQEVIRQVEKIGLICKKERVHFDLMVSLDGYGEIHDLVRGKPGNFERAKKVIEYVKSTELVDSLRIGCTVIRDNVNHLGDLLDFCIENNLYVKYRLGVPHQRLYTEDIKEPYALTKSETYELVEFLEGLIKNYERNYLQKHFYRSLIGQLVNNSPRKAGCDWKHRGATITAKGELAYCAVKSKALMSDISEGDPEKIYFDNVDHLNDIIRKSCDSCNHDYVGIPGQIDYLKSLIYKFDTRFGLKNKIKKLPFFPLVQRYRKKSAFEREYRRYSLIQKSIRIASDTNRTNKKIMICGWYGTETLGDKAILAGIVQSLNDFFDSEVIVSVVSLNVYLTNVTKNQMDELCDINVLSLEQAISSVANYDYLFFGGGPIMAINELAPMQVLFERAKQANVKTVAAGVGVGPLGDAWFNASIAKILDLCDARIYRDENSLRIAKSIDVNVDNDRVAEDPALSWLKKFESLDINTEFPDKSKKTLLLGLRDFPYQAYAADLTADEAIVVKNNYEASVVKALEELVTNDEWIIKPLPMCTNHFGDDDRWFYRNLFRDNKVLKPYLNYELLGRELSPNEYVAEFKSADLLLGMRFHSVVFGLGLGVRTIALDYTMGRGKVKALSDKFNVPVLSMIGLNSDAILDVIRSNINVENNKNKSIFEELKFESALEKTLLDLE